MKPQTMQSLVHAIVSLYPKETQTDDFRNTLREELTGYGWKPKAIKQVMSELQEIADGK